MSSANNSGEAEYPYAREVVFDAVLKAVPRVEGMSVHSADQIGGRIVAKAGMSLLSWGEHIPISLTEVTPGRTRVCIASDAKTGFSNGGFFDADDGLFVGGDLTFGKHRRNVDKIFAALSNELKSAKSPESDKKKCPFCAELIQAEAIKCRFCGSEQIIEKEEQASTEPEPTVLQDENAPKLVGSEVHFRCFTCEQPLAADSDAMGQEFRCPECGEHLTVPSLQTTE